MKEIQAKNLRVGDVFIDGDMFSVVESEQLYLYDIGLGIKAKCIIAPTSKELDADNTYFVHWYRKVLLCEEQDERDIS